MMCYDADYCSPLTCTKEAERGANVKGICGFLTESFVNDKIIGMTVNEFVHYQSTIINHKDSVAIQEARDIVQRNFKKNQNTIR